MQKALVLLVSIVLSSCLTTSTTTTGTTEKQDKSDNTVLANVDEAVPAATLESILIGEVSNSQSSIRVEDFLDFKVLPPTRHGQQLIPTVINIKPELDWRIFLFSRIIPEDYIELSRQENTYRGTIELNNYRFIGSELEYNYVIQHPDFGRFVLPTQGVQVLNDGPLKYTNEQVQMMFEEGFTPFPDLPIENDYYLDFYKSGKPGVPDIIWIDAYPMTPPSFFEVIHSPEKAHLWSVIMHYRKKGSGEPYKLLTDYQGKPIPYDYIGELSLQFELRDETNEFHLNDEIEYYFSVYIGETNQMIDLYKNNPHSFSFVETPDSYEDFFKPSYQDKVRLINNVGVGFEFLDAVTYTNCTLTAFYRKNGGSWIEENIPYVRSPVTNEITGFGLTFDTGSKAEGDVYEFYIKVTDLRNQTFYLGSETEPYKSEYYKLPPYVNRDPKEVIWVNPAPLFNSRAAAPKQVDKAPTVQSISPTIILNTYKERESAELDLLNLELPVLKSLPVDSSVELTIHAYEPMLGGAVYLYIQTPDKKGYYALSFSNFAPTASHIFSTKGYKAGDTVEYFYALLAPGDSKMKAYGIASEPYDYGTKWKALSFTISN